jgi:small subunit ribosomal protein S7
MPRKSFKIHYKSALTDTVYKNTLVRLFVTQMIKNGKARLAHRLLYNAIDICGTSKEDGVEILAKAVGNTTPNVEVRPRRKGGSVYQVPVDIPIERGTALAVRWIVQSARSRAGRSMSLKLASEFQDAAKNNGASIRKRDDMQRMAEANKAFAHMRR